MLLKCCTQYDSKFEKLSSGQTGKRVFIPIPKNKKYKKAKWLSGELYKYSRKEEKQKAKKKGKNMLN